MDTERERAFVVLLNPSLFEVVERESKGANMTPGEWIQDVLELQIIAHDLCRNSSFQTILKG